MKKIIFLLVLTVFFLGLVFLKNQKKENQYPLIELKGDNIISLKMDEDYKEPGFKAIDSKDGNITNKVEIKNNIDYNKPGTYEIVYSVINSKNNKFEIKRYVNLSLNKNAIYKDEYDNIDNTKIEWGTNNKKDGTRASGTLTIEELKKYDAYFIGPDKKVLYLTFDEGSNDTYLSQIVEVLNKNNIKATFFLCKNFILNNPGLMKILVNNGHSVGNHTANHYDMTKYANRGNYQKYINEIKQVEDAFKKVTGTNLDKVYREPRGVSSYRSLALAKSLGYKTYFWSSAYVDFQEDLSKDAAYKAMISRIHNGAIYLIHPKNKGNYEAMDDFIKEALKLGYTFDLVKNIK